MATRRSILGLLFALFGYCGLMTVAGAQVLVGGESMWVTDGNVRAVARGGGRVYLGGDFDYVGPATGAGVTLDADTGALAAPAAGLTGIVYDAVSDGSRGWYVARDLRTDGIDGPSLVHVLPDGTLDPLALPQPDGPIYALARSGEMLYLGGDFAAVDGQTRSRAAAVDLASRTVLGWHPPVSGTTTCCMDGVLDLVSLDDAIVLAGNFAQVGGQPRRNLAAVDPLDAQLLAWNPDPDFPVNQVVPAADRLYLGGVFTRVGGVARASLAAVDRASGAVLPWNPSPNGQVYALALSGTTVYAGGTFTLVGGQSRNGVAAVNAASGAVRAWNPLLDVNLCSALAVRGNAVYLGGLFGSVSGQERLKLAAVDATSGQPLPWTAHTTEPAHVLALDGATLFAGGAFNSVGGVARAFGAALDQRTGAATAWNPQANGSITDIAFVGATLFVVGGFRNIGGAQRNYAAELDAETGSATGWSPPDIDLPPHRAVVVTPAYVYVGGEFSQIGTRFSGGLAELDRTTGALTPRDLGTESAIGISVDSLVLDAPARVLYAGGFFSRLAGALRPNLGAIDLRTGEATSWNPGVRGQVGAMDDTGDVLYVAGDFDRLAGAARQNAGAVSKATGQILPWRPELGGTGLALAAGDAAIYVGGDFTEVRGMRQLYAAALDPLSGALLDWDAAPRGTGTFTFSGFVYDIQLDGRIARLGGDFSTLLDRIRSGVGVVTTLEAQPR